MSYLLNQEPIIYQRKKSNSRCSVPLKSQTPEGMSHSDAILLCKEHVWSTSDFITLLTSARLCDWTSSPLPDHSPYPVLPTSSLPLHKPQLKTDNLIMREQVKSHHAKAVLDHLSPIIASLLIVMLHHSSMILCEDAKMTKLQV